MEGDLKIETQARSALVSAKFANMSLLSAVLVVIIHVFKRNQEFGTVVWWMRQFLGEGVCRIAVPFFFLAAGYFLAKHFNDVDWWRNEVSKRIKTLIAPFVTWSLICFFLCSLIIIVKNLHNGACWKEGLFTCRRLLVAFGLNPFTVPELRQLWFVRVLFCLVLVSPLLRFVVSGGVGGILLLWLAWVAGKFVWPELCETRWWMFMNFGLISFEGLFFFVVGLRFRIFNFDWLRISKRFSFSALILGLVILAVKTVAVYLKLPYVQCLACLYIPLLLLGSLGVMPSVSVHGILHKLHFPIFLIHLNVVFIYFAFLSYLPGSGLTLWVDPGRSCFGALVCFVCVTVCSLLVFALLDKISVVNKCLRTALWGGRI